MLALTKYFHKICKEYYVGAITGVRYRRYHAGDKVPTHLLDNEEVKGRYEVLTSWCDTNGNMIYKSTWEPLIAHSIEIEEDSTLKYPELERGVEKHPLSEFIDANQPFLNL